MLNKLIKHESAAVSRFYLPMFAILLFTSAMTYLMSCINFKNAIFEIIPGFMFVLFAITVVVMLIGSLIVAVIRFYKNFMTSEGYLTFTLPVSVKSLLFSKLLVAYAWILASWILTLLCVQVVVDKYCNFSILAYISDVFLIDFPEINLALLGIGFIVMILISIFSQLMTYYLSITLGQVISRNKILGSVAAYFVISFAVQMLTMIILLIAVLIIGFDRINEVANSLQGFYLIIILSISVMLVTGISAFVIIKRTLKNKLNLE